MKKLLLRAAIASCFLYSCVGNNCALPDETNSGEIITNAQIINSSAYCYQENSNGIIRTDTNESCNIKVSFDGGKTEKDIDFSLYTVLSNSGSGQCNISMDSKVTRDDANKYVNYKITINECGICKSEITGTRFVLVPKIPDDYSVDFTVENK